MNSKDSFAHIKWLWSTCAKILKLEAKAMAHRLRIRAVLEEEAGLCPSTHMAPHMP